MAHIRQRTTRRPNTTVTSGLPKVLPSDLQKFKERWPDPEDVIEFAYNIRRFGKKYEDIEDDYELCIMYLKEKHIASISENVKLAIPTIGVFGDSALSKFPNVQVFLTGIMGNSGKVSEWFAYVYEPDYNNASLGANGNETVIGSMIPIPRDEVTIHDMKTVLDDCKVPKPIISGAMEMFSGNFGFKSILAGLRIVSGLIKPGDKVDASGFLSQISEYE